MKGGANKVERKIAEKNRRMHMKTLCFKLSSLIPKEDIIIPSKDMASQFDHLDQATSYIKKLRERIERLKQEKTAEIRVLKGLNKNTGATGQVHMSQELPVVEVRQLDTNLEVILISRKQFLFHKVIRVLEEEGAEVINASFSVVGDKIFYTIHSQAISSRIGLEESRVSERLKELVL